MSQEGSVSRPHEPFRAGSSVAKSAVISPSTSNDNSFSSSPAREEISAAESEGDSDPSTDSRDEESSARVSTTVIPNQPNQASENSTTRFLPSSDVAQGHSTGATSSLELPSVPQTRPTAASSVTRRPSFGLGFLSSISNTIRGSSNVNSPIQTAQESPTHQFMSNSPTLANLNNYTTTESNAENTLVMRNITSRSESPTPSTLPIGPPLMSRENTTVEASDVTCIAENEATGSSSEKCGEDTIKNKDGTYTLRLTPIIDHSSSNSGLYFSPIIRRIEPKQPISVGRYTEKHKSAAHAPQGSSSRVVFKSKVVSRTHASFECNDAGSWFLKDCKSSSGTFLNNIRLSQASSESTLWPVMDGDIVQLGLDYRGGTEEVYRCVKMRCEFNRSWQRKVNRFDLDIHKKMKGLGIEGNSKSDEEFSECAICLLKLEPCQALFISPCSHSWHYKCIRPIIIKRYPQFYCPNCRSVCDLETDVEDEGDCE